MSRPTASRKDWIARSQFHDLSEAEIFQKLYQESEKIAQTGRQPIVILDLDSTLYEVQPRTHRILREWAEGPESAPYPDWSQRLRELDAAQVGYSLRDTLFELGADEATARELHRSLRKFWEQRFFSNHYLSFDQPYAGAVDFTRVLERQGVMIVYLTGRDNPQMGEATRRRLEEDGFAWGGPHATLILKEQRAIEDLLHKKRAAERIRSMGSVVASFENEPRNLVALQEVFPSAMHVFVDTAASDRPAPIGTGLYRIRGYSQHHGRIGKAGEGSIGSGS